MMTVIFEWTIPLTDINWGLGFWHGWCWLTGATDLEATLKTRKERYRYPCNSTDFRDKEMDLRVPRVTDAEKKVTRCVFVNVRIFGDVLVLIFWPVPLKRLFASEASAYRKQRRDDITRLDTAEPPEGLLQYRTDLLSPCRYAWIYTSAHTQTHVHTCCTLNSQTCFFFPFQ